MCIYLLFNFKTMPGMWKFCSLVSHSLGSKLNFSHLVFEIKIEEIIVSLGTTSFWSAVCCTQQDIWICVSWRTFPRTFPEELSSVAVTDWGKLLVWEAQSSMYKRLPGLMVPFLLLSNFKRNVNCHSCVGRMQNKLEIFGRNYETLRIYTLKILMNTFWHSVHNLL